MQTQLGKLTKVLSRGLEQHVSGRFLRCPSLDGQHAQVAPCVEAGLEMHMEEKLRVHVIWKPAGSW